MLGDPIASRELLEQRLVEPSRCKRCGDPTFY
jgi:hypothetical protein